MGMELDADHPRFASPTLQFVDNGGVIAWVQEYPAPEAIWMSSNHIGDRAIVRSRVDPDDLTIQPDVALGRHERAMERFAEQASRSRLIQATGEREQTFRRRRKQIVHRGNQHHAIDASRIHFGDHALWLEHPRLEMRVRVDDHER